MERHAESSDADAIARAAHPVSWDRRRSTFEALDPQFAATWADHVGRLFARPQLDLRKRLLVLTAQYTMRGDLAALEETLVAAADAGVDMGEALEAILQCYVYAGQGRVGAAAEVFLAVAQRMGFIDAIGAEQPALDVATADRSLEDEQADWADADRDDPRIAGFLDRYGWHGISTGLRLRPGHHINLVATLDAIDPGFLQIWLDTVYRNLYSRHVLDDATRLLCVVANCFAVGETHQSRRHMRGALRQGATPKELLEVIFQSCAIVGHPHMLPLAVDDLITIADEEGRLGELVSEDRIEEVRSIVARRVARRDTLHDLGATSAADAAR